MKMKLQLYLILVHVCIVFKFLSAVTSTLILVNQMNFSLLVSLSVLVFINYNKLTHTPIHTHT